MIALTSNPIDFALAAALGAAVVIGLVGYLLGRPQPENGTRPCRCMFCRDLRAGR
jgi:sugar phosphate isomerase/epimerase